MGKVTTVITLRNAADIAVAERGIIKEAEIRTTTVTAVVDTGAGTLVINEDTRQKLGLKIKNNRNVLLANGMTQDFPVTEPVMIQWKNRDTTCPALVLPQAKEILLGAIPLEDMDLMVNPAQQELTGAHGDKIVCLAL